MIKMYSSRGNVAAVFQFIINTYLKTLKVLLGKIKESAPLFHPVDS